MMVVERASEEDLLGMIEIDRLTLGDESRRETLVKAVIDREALIARQGSLRLGFALMNRAFFGQMFVALVVVHPDHRRQGVASALLAYAEKTCPAPRLFTSTNDSNIAMQTLLTKRGYQPSGVIYNLDPGGPERVFVRFLDSVP